MLNINAQSAELLGKTILHFEAPEVGISYPISEKPLQKTVSTLVFCFKPIGSGAIASERTFVCRSPSGNAHPSIHLFLKCCQMWCLSVPEWRTVHHG